MTKTSAKSRSGPGPAEAPASTPAFRVGVLSPLTGGQFWGEIVSGIVRSVSAAGGSVVLFQTFDSGRTVANFRAMVGSIEPVGWQHIDGFVSLLRAVEDDVLREVQEAGKPVVTISYRAQGVEASSVGVDNVSGIRDSVAHLVEHGHTGIGFLALLEHSDVVERYEAYCAAMAEHGLEPRLVPAVSDLEKGGALAAAVVRDDPDLTAVVTATDRNALGLVDGLRQLGVVVPRDVAVIGFDDLEGSWHHDPPLTTSRQDFTELGVVAGAALVAELRGDAAGPRSHAVPTTLMLRSSCGCDMSSTADASGVAGLVAAAVATIAGAVRGQGPDGVTGEVDRHALDATIADAVRTAALGVGSDEDVRSFLHMVVERLTTLGVQIGGPEGARFAHAAGQVAGRFVQAVTTTALTRLTGVLLGYDNQFSVSVAMLEHGEGDVAELGWMASTGVRGACMGLWDGPPADGRIVIAGVHGGDGRLDGHVGTRRPVEEFPPTELFECADPLAGEVTYVVPVRGVSGNHGFLCVVGTPEWEFSVPRSDFDHWAALLGEKLCEQRLVEEIRQSEERYAFAARAANDGLWEWTTGAENVYLSARCRELLGVPPDDVLTPKALAARVHPHDRPALVAALNEARNVSDVPVQVECRLTLPGGQRPWLLVRALGVARDDGSTGLVGSVANIDKRKTLEERLRRAAMVDEVTGLPNRRFFLERLRHGIGRGARGADAWFAVLFLDLDGFKLINDSLGHLAGDELLRVVGDRLRATLRATDTAARFGGDEFAILLADQMPEDLLAVAQRVQERITAPVTLGNHQVRVTASIGITTSATQYVDPEDVLRDADIAMYRAKEDEGGGVRFFDMSMHQSAIDRLRLRGELGAALQNHEFVVHYQPIVDLADTTVHRFEALTRWQHPTRGLLGPGEFLPAMEGSDAIVALDRLVLDEVCAQIVRWRADSVQPVHVSVNVSHRTFWSEGFLDTVQSTLDRHGVPPECVNLELTENIIMTDPDLARATMAGLRDIGVGLYIDDFGTGHSSLHLLRTFPLDTLKIAGPFVSELTEIAESAALVQAIITMASALGMSTVAECVETTAQADHLRALGCTGAQGWLYARALPAEDATVLLGTRLEPLVAVAGPAR